LSSASLLGLNQLPGGVPKAYLRVLSFSRDSVLVDQRTLQLSAAARNNYQSLSTGPLIVQQDGYVSVYVGNESPADVYFDDITIEHRQGLQVQENSYDPFGLDLAGVSSAAPGLRLKNFYQFNGKENQLDLGLNWNHQDWRFFDYQLGRWHVVDPEIENAQEAWTPYQFGFDNAVRFADADGRNPGGGFGGGFVEGFVGTFTGIRDAAVAAVQSPQAFASAVAGIAVESQLPVMMYRAMQQTTARGTAIAEGNSTETGRQAGGVAAQLTIAAVTEGASRAVGTVRGLARGTEAVEGEKRAISVATSKSGGHSMVGIQAENGSNVWFHQTAEGMKGVGKVQVGAGKFAWHLDSPGAGFKVNSVQVPAENAANAMAKAKSMVGPNNYNSVTNSCVTYTQQVLKTAGVKTGGPAILTPNRLQSHIQKLGQ
jgi:RHS repeat-associated protein